MSDVRRRAEEARRLLNDEGLKGLLTEIRDGAVAAFLVPSATAETLAAAHERVRAVETILTTLNTRLSDWAIEERKESLHRGTDRR